MRIRAASKNPGGENTAHHKLPFFYFDILCNRAICLESEDGFDG